MFGSGFGVSVTAAELCPVAPRPPLPAGVAERPARLGEMLPVARRSDEELAVELQRVVRAEAAIAAYKAELVVELAARRPAALDTPGRRAIGAPDSQDENAADGGASEFFCDELALVVNCSRTAASLLFEQARTLTERLPATWAALADGALDWPRARALAAELGRPTDETDPRIVAAVEAAVLPRAAALSVRKLRGPP
jgi:hypothetical protein